MQEVRTRIDAKSQPNIRKLARALIALARRRLEEAPPDDEPQPGEAGQQ